MLKLLEKIRTFRDERNWDQFHSPKNLTMALMVEAAELAEHFQWLTEEQSRNLSAEKLQAVREEMSDVFIYLLNLADKLEINLLDAAHEKIIRNAEKYPVHKVRGQTE